MHLATEDDLRRDYPDFDLGTVPSVGGARRDPVIVDSRVAARESVVLEAGSYEQSVRIATSDCRVPRAGPCGLAADRAALGAESHFRLPAPVGGSKRAVRPMMVVMAGIDAKPVLELPSAEDEQPVEALASHAADPALHTVVGATPMGATPWLLELEAPRVGAPERPVRRPGTCDRRSRLATSGRRMGRARGLNARRVRITDRDADLELVSK